MQADPQQGYQYRPTFLRPSTIEQHFSDMGPLKVHKLLLANDSYMQPQGHTIGEPFCTSTYLRRI